MKLFAAPSVSINTTYVRDLTAGQVLLRQGAVQGRTNRTGKTMTITDHFQTVEDPGFRRSVDPEAARRQLRMSFGLVVLLAIAAGGLALSLRFEPPMMEAGLNAPVKLVVQSPQRVEIHEAASNAKELPGG
ncbi:MAG TPA: hypothetical protein VG271_17185 [Beijerinckiaceae bacterium]|jgi:hypothetical protein|nr:hypothetical protein [Beijerinckiaceae bacterium]